LLQEDHRQVGADGKRDELLVRIEKGGVYYNNILQASMKALFQHTAQVEMLSRTKEYANALKEIDGMLMKKVGTIAKVGYITTCILNGTEVQRKPELEKAITDERAAMVGEVRAWAEENKPKTSGKTGKKRKRRSRDDTPVDDTRNVDPPGRPAKGSTYEKTYALRKEGLTLEEIAAKRSMAKSTIEGHFARGIEEGAMDIDGLIPDAERDRIADWMREHPDASMSSAQLHFIKEFSYGQLRMVQAWVKKDT